MTILHETQIMFKGSVWSIWFDEECMNIILPGGGQQSVRLDVAVGALNEWLSPIAPAVARALPSLFRMRTPNADDIARREFSASMLEELGASHVQSSDLQVPSRTTPAVTMGQILGDSSGPAQGVVVAAELPDILALSQVIEYIGPSLVGLNQVQGGYVDEMGNFWPDV